MKRCLSAAALLACAAGQALAQPTVDGQKGTDIYGPILWVQTQPTSYGNNAAGVGGNSGNPQDVVYGMEIAIPLAAIGSPNPANGIKIAGFLNNGSWSYVSNQVLGGVPANTGHLQEPRNLNFATLGEDQTLVLHPPVRTAAPVIDGQLDGGLAGYWAGTRAWTQNNYTSFANSTLGLVGQANGSEIDGLYAVVYDNATPADPSDDVLDIFLTGNDWDFNKICLFFDTVAGGQNRLLFGNSTQGGLTRMSEDPSGNGNGLRFETGFEADYYLTFGGGNSTFVFYVDYATIPTDPVATPPAGFYIGTAGAGGNGDLTGGNGVPPVSNIKVAIDNRNTIGVTGLPSNVSTPSPDYAFGSEIDGLYGTIVNNRLYLLITGNLETGFQKLDLFFDVTSSDGQNQLGYDATPPGATLLNCDVEFNGLNRMGAGGNGTAGAGNGVKFDTGFFADYFLTVTNGSVPVENYVNVSLLRADGARYVSGYVTDYSAFDGGVKSTHNPVNFAATYADIQDFSTTDPLNTDCGPRRAYEVETYSGPPPAPTLTPGLILVSINNSNVAGVSGTNPIDVSGAGSVTTGIELSVSLTELGWDGTSPVRVAGFINGEGHGFVSNQVLGGLPTPIGQQFAPDLGEPTLIDFSAIAGNQFVVIPPPCGSADFNCDGDTGTDADIESFFACLAGNCPSAPCPSNADFNADGDTGTDADIESFFRVLAGGNC